MAYPPIFLINLDDSTERLKHSWQELNKFAIPFERISGVYGKKLSEEQISQHYSKTLNEQVFHRPLGTGEIGCYFSHRKAWQTIVDRKLPYAIVLEDDFNLAGDLNEVVAQIESLPLDWELIKLAAYENRTRPVAHRQPLNPPFELVVHNKPITGCCAQAISYAGAKKLLAATATFGRPVDTDIQHSWETKVAVFALMPFIVKQRTDLNSDIQANSGSKRIAQHKLRKLKLQLQDKVKNALFRHKQIAALKRVYAERNTASASSKNRA
ncbi:glycosyltransferase family 25 protein [Pseudoalteromonas fenneropenaei]|uniref:Glycosyltransferase family 25 protein n=1 Tax=Pseudoalteromonas fenneropenaei TaxID=1737459 RepID=A0ABV7CIZ1_9GAMM